MQGKKIRRILVIFLSVLSIFGSFYVELFQTLPCNFCLIIRYSVVAVLILSSLSLILEKIFLLNILPIGIAFWADMKLISGEFFSQTCEQNTCFTPEFLGIRMSIWALIVLSAFSIILLLELKESLKR